MFQHGKSFRQLHPWDIMFITSYIISCLYVALSLEFSLFLCCLTVTSNGCMLVIKEIDSYLELNNVPIGKCISLFLLPVRFHCPLVMCEGILSHHCSCTSSVSQREAFLSKEFAKMITYVHRTTEEKSLYIKPTLVLGAGVPSKGYNRNLKPS